MSKPRIGFVGVGLMGHGIARNLVAKDFPVTLRLHRNRKAAEDLLAGVRGEWAATRSSPAPRTSSCCA